MHHGVFTFSNDAHDSYSRMIEFAARAEAYLQDSGAEIRLAEPQSASPDSLESIRRSVSDMRERSITLNLDQSPDAVGFSNHPDLSQIATRGPLTPDHSIFAKRIPVILQEDFSESIESYSREYKAYFERNTNGDQARLDPAPRWAVWPGKGLLSFGSNQKEAKTIIDIARHTAKVIQLSEHLGGWRPLTEAEIFEVEYWELEQAKLKNR